MTKSASWHLHTVIDNTPSPIYDTAHHVSLHHEHVLSNTLQIMYLPYLIK